ncbi:Mannitol dehydrogenase C-terminal domain protein [Sodalis praecaptivus]|uniref:Mannitol dehydrogenase C-terminal domain protein n=1 Tax=Sodalis praecaptivus TaxID=1239307 RepID=W0HWZ3_9GAMM|nr:2-dehydropantoate 2-reductase N-terminal domain-containing protein [Sodalis praecaptivus]AHF76673.1 Mannitol dehydrogenase C-terminal domain protein [Sodalis praecaptivus]
MSNTPSAVIIGAGQTGRGFIARFLAKSGYHLTFIDNNDKTVQYLQEDNFFTIHCFDETVRPVHIHDFTAYRAGTPEALRAIAAADVLFVSVGQQNLPVIAKDIALGVNARRKSGLAPLKVLTAENGVSPGQILGDALRQDLDDPESVAISEVAIFCTTNVLKKTRLDIGTENYNRVPYNARALGGELPIKGFVAEADMTQLLKRKIYTYNFISACVTYLGAYKGIEDYATSANDQEVRELIFRVVPELNKALCKVLAVDAASQETFSDNALKKFSDYTIEDYVSKNAREVSRKLRPDDRMIAPANMIIANAGDTHAIAIVIAAALFWGEKNEKLLATYGSVDAVLTSLSQVPADSALFRQVKDCYAALKQGTTITQLLK